MNKKPLEVKSLIRGILALGLAACGPALWAAAPARIAYQGKLANTAGVPTNGTVNLTFSICTALTGGSCPFSEAINGVVVNNGLFSVVLGAAGTALPPSTFDGNPKYLDVAMGGTSFSPRQQLTASPWALAVAAGSVGASEIVNGSIGIGELDQASVGTVFLKLDSNGNLNLPGPGTVKNVPNPSANTDAANKAYVDSVAVGGGGPWGKTGANVTLNTASDNVGVGGNPVVGNKLSVTGNAAISGSLSVGSFVPPADSVTTVHILNGTIKNEDITSAVADLITYSKLNLAGSIKGADISAAVADRIPYAKLNVSGQVLKTDIANSAKFGVVVVAGGHLVPALGSYATAACDSGSGVKYYACGIPGASCNQTAPLSCTAPNSADYYMVAP